MHSDKGDIIIKRNVQTHQREREREKCTQRKKETKSPLWTQWRKRSGQMAACAKGTRWPCTVQNPTSTGIGYLELLSPNPGVSGALGEWRQEVGANRWLGHAGEGKRHGGASGRHKIQLKPSYRAPSVLTAYTLTVAQDHTRASATVPRRRGRLQNERCWGGSRHAPPLALGKSHMYTCSAPWGELPLPAPALQAAMFFRSPPQGPWRVLLGHELSWGARDQSQLSSHVNYWRNALHKHRGSI